MTFHCGHQYISTQNRAHFCHTSVTSHMAEWLLLISFAAGGFSLLQMCSHILLKHTPSFCKFYSTFCNHTFYFDCSFKQHL